MPAKKPRNRTKKLAKAKKLEAQKSLTRVLYTQHS